MTMAHPAQPELITMEEAAERLAVHPKTIYRMQARGELPTAYVGNHRYTTAEGVEAVLTPPDPVIVLANSDATRRAAARLASREPTKRKGRHARRRTGT